MLKDGGTEQASPCLLILLSSWLHSSSTLSLRSRMESRTGSKEASGFTSTGGRSPDSRGLHMDSYVWRKTMLSPSLILL